MSKHVNWNEFYKAPVRRRGQYESSRDLFSKSRAIQEQVEAEQKEYKTLEPLLKKCLMDAMVQRKPIEVLRPFPYFTEEFQKSETGPGFFREVSKMIPAGTKLTFQGINRTLKQWIFKSQDGQEIEIYDAPIIMFGNNPTSNPAWYGLLRNTSIYEEVRRTLGRANQSSEGA